jgi:hypothetical protein
MLQKLAQICGRISRTSVLETSDIYRSPFWGAGQLIAQPKVDVPIRKGDVGDTGRWSDRGHEYALALVTEVGWMETEASLFRKAAY